MFRAEPRHTSSRKCRTLGGDCDLFPSPLMLNLGHRREGPALSGAFLPPHLHSAPGIPRWESDMRGECVTRSFPPAFLISCFFFPHTMISPAQRSIALAALMLALPGSFPMAPSSPGFQSLSPFKMFPLFSSSSSTQNQSGLLGTLPYHRLPHLMS